MLGLDTQKLSITNYREATDSRQELANAPLYDIKGISFFLCSSRPILDPEASKIPISRISLPEYPLQHESQDFSQRSAVPARKHTVQQFEAYMGSIFPFQLLLIL